MWGFAGALFWHFAIYLSDTGSGQDPRKGRADFCFQSTAGNFDGEFLHGKRHGPNSAHLRVLWWNNSKCLSCIVWHAAWGVLKPLLPAPKAPLNKIVKNNSFTLIFPSDYCTRGGKLAAGPCASLFICKPLLPSLLLVFSDRPPPPPSLLRFFFFSFLPIYLSSLCVAGQISSLCLGRNGILLGQY